jgi:hypothetical protein
VLLGPAGHLDLPVAEPLEELEHQVLERGRVALAQPASQGQQPGAAQVGRSGRARDAGRRRGPFARLRLRHQRDRLAVDLEERAATGRLAPPVVLDERTGQRGVIATEGVGHELPLGAVGGDLAQRQGAAGAGQDLVGHLGRRREAAAALLLPLLAATRLVATAARDASHLARRDGVALAGPIGQLLERRRIDQVLEAGRVLVELPLDQGEGAGQHRHEEPLGTWQAAMGGHLVGHHLFGDLADVIEEVLTDRDLGDLPEVKRLPLAPQHLDGGFGESHGFP